MEFTDAELNALSAKILDLDIDAPDDEIEDRYRDLVAEVHPDSGGSLDEFKAIDVANDILQDSIQVDKGKKRTASDRFEGVLTESEIDEALQDARREPSDVSGSASDMVNDFAEDFKSGSTEEVQEQAQHISVLIKTKIIYESFVQFTKDTYTLGDAQIDAVNYTTGGGGGMFESVGADENSDTDEVPTKPPDMAYYDVMQDGFVEDFTKEEFKEGMQKLQQSFDSQYRGGASIDDVSDIIAQLVVADVIDMSSLSGFKGSGGDIFNTGWGRDTGAFGGSDDTFNTGWGRDGGRR